MTHKENLLAGSAWNFCRPFRPRQPAEQAGEDQPQQSSAEEQLQGEERQTEDSKVQANDDVAAGQRQQRSVRRRRQRNSESSTSKVSPTGGVCLKHGYQGAVSKVFFNCLQAE